MPELMCLKCGERPATEIWAENGIMGYIHGQYQNWCKRCVLTTQLTYAKNQAMAVELLERELLELTDQDA